MILTKENVEQMIENVEKIFDSIFDQIPEKFGRKWIKEKFKDILVGGTLEDLKKLVENREPKFFLIGKTQDGKSSLINAIIGEEKVITGNGKHSVTRKAEPYRIELNNLFLNFFDSRGYFESKPLQQEESAIEQLNREILQYDPHIILLVLNANNIASAQNELEEFKKTQKRVKESKGVIIPTIVVINKIDKLDDIDDDWPPEKYQKTSKSIQEAIDTVKNNLTIKKFTPIYKNNPYKGYQIDNDETFCGIIPTCARFKKPNKPWNIETLIDFIGENISLKSLIKYSAALETKKGLKKISTGYIHIFAAVNGVIGAIPNLIIGQQTVKHVFVIRVC